MKKLILSSLLLLITFRVADAQEQTDTIVLFFDIGKSVVDVKNAKLLNKLISHEDDILISIYGYTDFLGSVSYNQQLSEKRSTNVNNYLLKEGIDKNNIVFSKGKGIHPNSIEQNRQNLSDKGIQAHRVVYVIYTSKPQEEQEKRNVTTTLLTEENLVVNSNIVLENIMFHSGKSTFLPESYADLEELLRVMQKYHTLKIEIQGHICCVRSGNDTGGGSSLNRAKAVYNFLFENGIDSTRMTYVGFGTTRKRYPLERNSYERQMNRRVEILILEI